MLAGSIALILIFCFILIKSSDMVIVSVRRLSRQTHTKISTISAVILAVGTSLPEVFVGLTSALRGSPSISLGTVTGSNIANISLVAGFAALVAGKVRVHGKFLKHDIWIATFGGILPVALLVDGQLNRVDGLILLSVYGAYASSLFRSRYEQIAEEQSEESFFYRFLRKFNHIAVRRKRELGKLFLGIALMIFSADIVVRLGTYIAQIINLPEFLVGLIVVAIGTSLPELAFSFRSLGDHEPSMFFGNLLGSTIANSTLVLGIVSLISPFHIAAPSKYFVAGISFVVIYLSFWYFIRSKHRLDRWEALVMLVLYATFLVVEFIQL
ncbi:calcium/sodium antiporter [Candidatus Woesebacteria bacterium]|nr:calcium/sodium antiporter [Candidatus Woesebacteria bacterium]